MWTTSIDFSKARKLKEVTFRCGTTHIMWIISALRTITSEHEDLQQISIHIPYYPSYIADPANIRGIVGEEVYRQWMDLDHLVVQFWESRTIRPKIMHLAAEKGLMVACIGVLLPEITKRGISELVNLYEFHEFL